MKILNKYQTQLTDKYLDGLHSYVKVELLDCIERIEFIQKLIAHDRPYAKDLKRYDKPYHKNGKETPNGKIKVDLENPHILENMDYFREAALHFEQHGVYTLHHPSKHPNSAYRQFWDEEIRRCKEGMVRPSDGEWITGYNYYYWNYSPIMVAVARDNDEDIPEDLDKIGSSYEAQTADRIEGFPYVWDMDYFYYHYLEQAESEGKYGTVLKTRGRGYSFKGGSLLNRNYQFYPKSKSWALASEKGDLIDDGLLTKAWDNMDFINSNTPWIKKRQERNTMMHKRASYKDLDTDSYKGYKSEIIGVTTNNKPEKARGKRGKCILMEEAGRYLDLLKVWGIARPSMEQGSLVYGLMIAFGTGGCLTAGNKVWDNEGNLINIEDVTKNTGIIGFKNGFNKEPVTWLQPPSSKECFKITTNTGRSLECSMDHPIYKGIQKYGSNITHNEFIETQFLNVGDYIGVIEEVDIWSNKTLEHARSIGMIIGDGTYGNNQSTRFANADKELFDYLEKSFELKVLRSHITKDNRVYKEVRVGNFNKYLRSVGIYGQTKTEKRLPNDIHSYSKDSVCELIGGLFDTDGYISIRDNKARPGKKICEVSISQSSLELIKEIQLLLQKLGIHSSIRVKQPRKNNSKDKNVWYELLIRDGKSLKVFSNNINLLVSKKQERLNQISKYVKTINFNSSSHDGLRYEKITSIENIGIKPVYNLTAGDSNTYIGNGIITHNTEGAAFEGLEKLFYEGRSFRVKTIRNIFDKTKGQGECAFYCGEYMNRENCYDKNGNSDVIKALVEIFYARLEVISSSTDPKVITQEKADRSITPQEAVMRTEGNLFPISDLKDYLSDISPNLQKFVAPHYIGEFSLNESGVKFKINNNEPVRKINPSQNENRIGAVEIFKQPILNAYGKIPYRRYIMGVDPYDDDSGTSMGSVFVFDLWSDEIVAEYTGRPKFANDFFEIVRRLGLYYNAIINYENKNKGMFSYFERKHSLNLLCDNPSFLKGVDGAAKRETYGNKAKGTHPTKEVNALGRRLQRDWMLSDSESESDTEIKVPKLRKIRSVGYIRECISWNEEGNFDRVSAMGMVMVLREELLKYNTDVEEDESSTNLANDKFWLNN